MRFLLSQIGGRSRIVRRTPGQSAGLIHEICSAKEVVTDIVQEATKALERLAAFPIEAYDGDPGDVVTRGRISAAVPVLSSSPCWYKASTTRC